MRCWGELKSFRTQSVGEVSAVLSNSHFTVIPIFKQIKAGLMRWREPFSPAIKQTSPFWSGVKRSKRGVFFNEACQCSYGRGYTICIYQKPFFPTNTSSHLSQLFFFLVLFSLTCNIGRFVSMSFCVRIHISRVYTFKFKESIWIYCSN